MGIDFSWCFLYRARRSDTGFKGLHESPHAIQYACDGNVIKKFCNSYYIFSYFTGVWGGGGSLFYSASANVRQRDIFNSQYDEFYLFV